MAYTKRAASTLISMALEVNWPEANQSEIYLKYIATRPCAERLGAHGLFGGEENLNLSVAVKEPNKYPGGYQNDFLSVASFWL